MARQRGRRSQWRKRWVLFASLYLCLFSLNSHYVPTVVSLQEPGQGVLPSEEALRQLGQQSTAARRLAAHQESVERDLQPA